MVKNPDNPSINVYEVEALLLAFQLWVPAWHKKKVIIHTDNKTTVTGLKNLAIRGPANASLREILLLAARWDVSIKLQ